MTKTFKTVAFEFFENNRNSYSKSTIYSYQKMMTHFVPLYQNDITAVNKQIILKLLNSLAQTHKRKTIYNISGFLSTIFNYAVLSDYIDTNPCAEHEYKLRLRTMFRTAKQLNLCTSKEALTFDQAIMLLNACYAKSLEFGLATELLLCTGMRLGELAALRKCDITSKIIVNKTCNQITKELQLSAKWGSNGCLDTPETLRDMIAQFFSRNQSDWAFPYIRFYSKQYSKSLGLLSQRLGLPLTTAHTLRHTALTWLASEHSITLVKAIARHTNVRTTERYIHPETSEMRSALNSLSNRIDSSISSEGSGTRTLIKPK